MKKYLNKYYAADFETTIEFPNVYAWGIYGENEYFDGINIDSFMKHILSFKKSVDIYFHNGAKFDFHFILPVLKKYGYTVKPYTNKKKILKDIKVSEFEKSHLGEYQRFLKTKQYDYFADGNKKIFEIRIALDSKNKKGKNYTINFKDSNLLFPSKIEGYGNALNNHFKNKEFTKGGTGDIKYDKKYLYKDYDQFVNDKFEQAYLKQDCKILFNYLKLMEISLPRENWKITSGSTAMNYWKKEFIVKLVNRAIENKTAGKFIPKKSDGNFYFIKKMKNGVMSGKYFTIPQYGNMLFKALFPILWLNKPYDNSYVSNYVGTLFNGGLTMVNSAWKGIKVNVDAYDLNSAYSGVMIKEMFPYGKPFKGDGGALYPIKDYEINLITDTYNLNGLPFVFQRPDKAKVYSKKLIPANGTISLTSVEYERFKKYYKGEWTAKVIRSYKAISGKFLFGDYINKFYDLKKNATKIINDKVIVNESDRASAKLFLNSLFGKFGTKTHREGRIYNPDSKEWEITEHIEKATYYLPLAVYITAYTRMQLVDAVGFNFKETVYMDTDSLKIKQGCEKNFNFTIHQSNLGDWKQETFNETSIFRRAKQYMEGSKITTAGIDWSKEKYKPSINEMIVGCLATKQLRPVLFNTGKVLEIHNKELKPIWEYTNHPDDWFKNEKEYYEKYNKQLKKLMS